ncbi:NAD(P)-binding protein [Coprinellus micaceus]|uniref:NAD(P)-binding protein n=1 Tax=Coprinellus micaceus TaxID=71717 RepID=A0A4Y7TT15_COPMI|nr:NAD(P)-binding protein [Coprinellus micaceus]
MAKLTFGAFLRDQHTSAPSWLGFEAAKHFVFQQPGRLILACRNEEKGAAAVTRIKEETNFENVEVWSLDLANFSSVASFANRFEKEGGRLGVLVANAAVSPSTCRRTPDGWEESLQVNDLSTALLCLRLIPPLEETAKKFGAKPRIVIVTTEMHYWATVDDQVYSTPSVWQTRNSDEYCTPSLMGARYPLTKRI